ncbi:hypothetical protein ACQEWB_05760 [Streptomyces sp. CA-249302]
MTQSARLLKVVSERGGSPSDAGREVLADGAYLNCGCEWSM